MQLITRTTTIRTVAILATLACSMAWLGTYSYPVGITRISDDFWTIESSHGEIKFSRLYDDFPTNDYLQFPHIASPVPVWAEVRGFSAISDRVELADRAWTPRHPLGFGFGTDAPRPPNSSDKFWTLDANGDPVQTTQPLSDGLTIAMPRSHLHRQFILTIPWWFVSLVVVCVASFALYRTNGSGKDSTARPASSIS